MLQSNSVSTVTHHLSKLPYISCLPDIAATGCVIKAQVLAGGRGKGKFDNGLQGGVHVVSR